MRRVYAQALCLALFVSVASATTSHATIDVRASVRSPGRQISVSYFYDNLSSDGEWFQEPNYGWCWTPYDMAPNWRPYYNGHWAYTDYGWSWVSNERWGWATYHYGRWLFDDSYGWIWVPGTVWAPAWVAWRYGDDYVGWAPLPPGAGWDNSRGLSFGDVNSIPSHDWCFVPQTQILSVNIRLQVTSVARNVTLLQRTRDATRFEARGGRPVNLGIDVAQVERRIRRPVPRARIVDVDTPARGGGSAAGRGGVGFYRPTVNPVPPNQGPPSAVIERRNAISDAAVQRQRDAQRRQLDANLKAERARLLREQRSDLRAKAGARAEEVRQRHAAEQQAFDTHAAQQRQVLDQRMQKKIVKPDKGKAPAESAGRGKAQSRDRGQAQDQGQPQDNSRPQDKGEPQDKGHGKGGGKGGP